MGTSQRVVTPNRLGGWDVRLSESRRISSHHATLADAIAWAKDLVAQGGGGVVDVRDPDNPHRVPVESRADRLLYPSNGHSAANGAPAHGR
jgi:hypothetical protein